MTRLDRRDGGRAGTWILWGYFVLVYGGLLAIVGGVVWLMWTYAPR